MERGYEWWNSIKIGAGCNPIETDEGWLLFIHGVTGTCSGFVYSMGAVILDLENPSIVKYRLDRFVLTPEMNYETTGFVPNVIFPTSALVDEKTGRIAIYYGSADTYTSLAFTTIDEIIPFIKKHAR
jgi:beta-1,4-mannooligosaccharide/beta-1,4-mannosyl-N-acetylglucosamine phosphorylase